MLTTTFRIGLRRCPGKAHTTTLISTSYPVASFILTRHISSISTTQSKWTAVSKARLISTPISPSSITRSYGKRHVSAAADPVVQARPSQSAVNVALDWNSFFRLRTSRRRYTLASSIVSSVAVTGAMFTFLSAYPEMADELTKLIPLDQVVSMGILTFAATFLGWLIGPIFGNAVWKLLHRSTLPEFTVKERAFFERIKRHRVNPTGASANNPVPDFYGEKIGSVGGYRRWLKDQRAFNRKREGTY